MLEIICGIYCFENIINGKKYIGMSQNMRERVLDHLCELRNNKHENIHFQDAWNKYGGENFIVYILERCDKHILAEKEIYYIQKYNTTNNCFGYNFLRGGNKPPSFLGKKMTEESKKKISMANKGKKRTPEMTENWRKANEGIKRTPPSEETKIKISQSLMGHPVSQETIEKRKNTINERYGKDKI